MPAYNLPSPVGPIGLWISLACIVAISWANELRTSAPTRLCQQQVNKSVRRTCLYVLVAMAFALGLLFLGGPDGKGAALDFLACYLVEMSLSVDNLFVFLLLFERFKVTSQARHRVLTWGLVGALVMRAAFVLAGAGLLARFHRLFYVLGALLLFTAVRLLMEHGEPKRDSDELPWPVRLMRRIVPVASQDMAQAHPQALWLRHDRRLMITPLMLVLVAIETADIVFALDSVPAAFAITTDPWVVFAANLCAMMGLRSLFFIIDRLLAKLIYLRIALALILALVGLKLILVDLIEIPAWASLVAIVSILGLATAASLRAAPQKKAT